MSDENLLTEAMIPGKTRDLRVLIYLFADRALGLYWLVFFSHPRTPNTNPEHIL